MTKSSRRSRSPSRRRSRSRSRDRSRRGFDRSPSPMVYRSYRFDSPPRDICSRTRVREGVSGFSPAVTSTPNANLSDKESNLKRLYTTVGDPQTKPARELYVGNLPPGIDVSHLMEFLNAAMHKLSISAVPDNCSIVGVPALKAWISNDGHYAFVEFRTIEEATNSLKLTGLNCMGYNLRIGRPKTYPTDVAPLLAETGLTEEQLLSGNINALSEDTNKASENKDAIAAAQMAAKSLGSGLSLDVIKQAQSSPERLCIMNLPAKISDEKIRELVSTFGTLTFFQVLRKSKEDNNGICVIEYLEVDSERHAFDMITQNTQYQIMKAEECINKGHLKTFIDQSIYSRKDVIFTPQVPTRVLMLSNIVTREEVSKDLEYDEICEDIKLECQSFGKVEDIAVPRPIVRDTTNETLSSLYDESDVGYAFVKFSNVTDAIRARKGLSGRKFSGRVVECHYFSESRYWNRDFRNPTANFSKSEYLNSTGQNGVTSTGSVVYSS